MGPRRVLHPILIGVLLTAPLQAGQAPPHPPAAAASGAPAAANTPPKPVPVSPEFLRKMRAAIRYDDDLQQAYTYTERRRDVKISGLGKVTVGPMRTFEVYPSNQPGRTYKRLVAIEEKPLPADELARRDEEHRQSVIAEMERDKAESPAARNARLAKDCLLYTSPSPRD